MDTLSAILDGLQLRSRVLGTNEFTAPWGVWFPRVREDVPDTQRSHPLAAGASPGSSAGRMGSLYVITAGTCWLEVPGTGEALFLSAGDLVAMTDRVEHQLRDERDSPVRPIWEVHPAELLRRRIGVKAGGGGAVTKLLAVGLRLEHGNTNRLLDTLPPVIHIRSHDGHTHPGLDDAVRLLVREVDAYRDGAQTIINHLAHILFAQAVRAHVASLPRVAGDRLPALLDAQIGPVIAQLHEQLDAPWTVASLAERAAMSRSALAARFTAVVGEAPMQHLTRCRMEKAAGLLAADRTLSVKEIAAKVGYQSEAAFSNAFRRWSGLAPTAYRAEHASHSAAAGPA